MHSFKLTGLTLVVLAGAAGPTVLAADRAPATSPATTTSPGAPAEPAPRLYTNADLAKYGPPAPSTAPRAETVRTDDAANWAFVQATLDREAARLEAERRHALDTSRGAYSEPSSGFAVDSGYLPGYYGYGYGYGFDRGFRFDDGFRFGDIARSNRGFTPGLIPRGHHGRYTFLKGADVVPGPKSPSAGGGHGGKGRVSHHGGRGRSGGHGGGGRR